MIVAAQLTRLAVGMDPSIASDLAPLFEAEGERCGIAAPIRVAHWMAQMAVECQGFGRWSENLNYSAQGLTATWPGHFPATIAGGYAHQPEKIANLAYAGVPGAKPGEPGYRLGNGDEASGDGWRYRGRGAIMITGRANYIAASAWTGLNLVGDPDQLGAPGLAAVRTAADFWRVKNINAAADRDDIEAVTRAVNGGVIDLAARKVALNLAKRIWGV